MIKVRLFKNFKDFEKYEIGLMQKVISCMVVFFILISSINLIRLDVDFLKESVMVSKRMIVGQVEYMTAFSTEVLARMFVVDTNKGEGIIDKRARTEVEEIIALELANIAKRAGEGAREEGRGERGGEGNSLMASMGYLMVSEVYEDDREIKEEWRWRIFAGEKGIINRGKDVVDKGDKHLRDSIVTGEIIKEKGLELLLAKELSKIDIRDKNGEIIEIIKEEGIKNKRKLSLLKR